MILPTTPINLMTEKLVNGVRLTWEHTWAGEHTCEIYSKPAGGTYSLLVTLPPTVETYTCLCADGDTRMFQVRVKAGRVSAFTSPASIIIAHPYITAFIARCVVPPTTGMIVLLNNLASYLDIHGYWNRFDTIQLLNLETQQASLMNLKGNYFNPSIGGVVAHMVHTPKVGFQGDGNYDSYIDTGFDTSLGMQWQLNGASWFRYKFAATDYHDGVQDITGHKIRSRGNGEHSCINSDVCSHWALGAFNGWMILKRDASDDLDLYYNGAWQTPGTSVSTVVPTGNVHINHFNDALGVYQPGMQGYSINAFGGAFTDAEADEIRTDFQLFIDGVALL